MTDEKTYRKYSIIVPSYNRRDEIRELLESFREVKFPPGRMELIIADDGSTDGTREEVEQFKNRLPFALFFYHQQNKGPGAARNMGMERATGNFFIFVDSDCGVHPEWLSAIDRHLHQFQADAFGGRDSYRHDFPPLLKAINYSMTSFLTTGGLRGRPGKRLAKFYPRSFNMGLSRELYRKIGGFGSLRHGQDIEYSSRILKSGAKVVYVHDAVVFHKRRTSIRRFFRQVFNWGVARVNLYKIDKSMFEPLHAAPAVATVLFFLLIIACIVSYPIRMVARWIFLIGILTLLFSGLHAAFQYKNWRLIYLVPIIMPIQVMGYGLGFLSAFVRRVILGQGEFTGFEKRYYQ